MEDSELISITMAVLVSMGIGVIFGLIFGAIWFLINKLFGGK